MATERTPILPAGKRRLEKLARRGIRTAIGGAASLRHVVIPEDRSHHESVEVLRQSEMSGIAADESTVSLTAPTVGEEVHPHGPHNKLPSLDFDRVVNSYSIQATKRRLRKRGVAVPSTGSTGLFAANVASRDAHKQSHAAFWSLPQGKNVVSWLLTCSIGLLCSFVAVLILHCVETIVGARIAALNYALFIMENKEEAPEFKPETLLGRLVFKSFVKGSFRNFIVEHGFPGLFWVFCIYNLLLALPSSLLCLLYAPKAIGSGIPEAKAYLNGVAVPSFADFNTFVAKIVGTILSVSSGLIVGPEGPLVHVGAIIGQMLTKSTRLDMTLRRLQAKYPWFASTCGCAIINNGEERHIQSAGDHDDVFRTKADFKRSQATHGLQHGLREARSNDAEDPTGSALLLHTTTKPEESCCCPRTTILTRFVSVLAQFRNDTDRRDLISIGVAVGFAAAFGAPMGGLLYSIEEASSFFCIALMFRTLVATAIGTLVIAIYHGDLTKFSILSFGEQMAENDNDVSGSKFMVIPYCILLGGFGGLLGSLFNSCYRRLNEWRQSLYDRSIITGGWVIPWGLWKVAGASLITSALTFLLPLLLPNSWTCRSNMLTKSNASESQLDVFHFERFACDEGQVNVFAIFLLGSRDKALNSILTDPSSFGATTLLLCSATSFFLLVLTFGTALPMGLFMPTLLVGSSFGGALGLLIQEYSVPGFTPGHMALIGATAMLAGVQRTTFSLCVIMTEASGQTKALIPLTIAVIVARYVSDRFNEGFYHIVMEMKGYPFLEHHVKTELDLFSVSDVMTTPVFTIYEIQTAGELEKLLASTSVEGFPVIKESTKEYVGFIRRDQVVALLECSVFMEDTKEDLSRSVMITNVLKDAHEKNFHRVLLRDDDIYTGRSREKPTVRTSCMSNVDWLQDNVVRTQTQEGNHVIIGTDDILPMRQSVGSVGNATVELSENGHLIVQVDPSDAGKHVDISAAMNRGAYAVVENTPLSKSYNVFAALGLRTLPVLGEGGTVVGILSRSNLLPDYMSQRTGMDMHHH